MYTSSTSSSSGASRVARDFQSTRLYYSLYDTLYYILLYSTMTLLYSTLHLSTTFQEDKRAQAAMDKKRGIQRQR